MSVLSAKRRARGERLEVVTALSTRKEKRSLDGFERGLAGSYAGSWAASSACYLVGNG
jgi:hypothetical protein